MAKQRMSTEELQNELLALQLRREKNKKWVGIGCGLLTIPFIIPLAFLAVALVGGCVGH